MADDHGDDDDHGHDHGPEDPHIWTDPSRMVSAVEAFTEVAGQLEGVDVGTVEGNGRDYADALRGLDTEIEELLADVDQDDRVLVTNHEVFGYFADRYGFDVVGTVIPATSSMAEASQRELEDLVDVVEDHGVAAIFAEVSEDPGRAEAVAGEAGDVEVVELYGESLGGGDSGADTYVDMMRTNATLIAEALG
jgi:zinc/manganese transport system substrate-binding protein